MSPVTPLEPSDPLARDIQRAMAAPIPTASDIVGACLKREQLIAGANSRDGAALNLSGKYRCPMALPLPGPNALTRVPSASDPNGIIAWTYAQLTNNSDVPFAAVKKRVFVTLGGLDNLIRVFAPNELDAYRVLLAQTVSATDGKVLHANEDKLRALKTRFLGEARRLMDEEHARATKAGERFDRLAMLKAHGLVWPGWTIPRPGQAALAEVPQDDWRDARTGLRSQRVPLEAELILNTTFPIGVGSESYGVVFLRGENFGLSSSIAPAAADLAKKTTIAEQAAAARADNAKIRDDAKVAADAAVERAATTLDEFRKAKKVLADASDALTQASRAAEEAGKSATAAAKDERAPITQIESDLQLLAGTNLVINFASGRAEILPTSAPALAELVKKLQSPNVVDLTVTIEGHTDARGNPAKNQELSERRASAVRTYLINAGVSGDRLDALGMGSRQPLNPKDPYADSNRRVRVSVAIPPEREAELRARLAEAQTAYAASMEAHQRAVDEAMAAVTAAVKEQEAALATRKQTHETAVEAQTARVGATNTLTHAQRAAAKTDRADSIARDDRVQAEHWFDRSRSRGEGFFNVAFVDTSKWWDRTPPPQLAERAAQALLGSEARQVVSELFEKSRESDHKRLATAIGEILAAQQAKKSDSRVWGERGDTAWALWLGERARPRGQFINVAGTFGPQDSEPVPYRGVSIPLPEKVEPPKEIVMAVDVVPEAELKKPEPPPPPPPKEPTPDDELALEDAPSTGDTAPPPPEAATAAPPPPPGPATPMEQSPVWQPNLPPVPVGPDFNKPSQAKPDEISAELVVVAGPQNLKEPEDEKVVLDKELTDPDPVAVETPDAAALKAAADEAKRLSDEAAKRAADALAAAKAAQGRVGNGAAVQGPVRRGGSTAVRLNINFGFDSDVMIDASPLDSLVPKLLSEEFRGRRIQIAGHTDKTGSDQHNLALSLRRAQSVRNYLTRRGVPAEVMAIQGYGATTPIPGTDATDPANRRVVISVIPLQQ